MEAASPQRETVEQLAEDFVARFRRGERPPLSDYTERYPEHAEQIRDLFPALVMMEQIAPGSQSDTLLGSWRPPRQPPGEHPERIGDYRILREIGRGGMGIVYEAEQVSLGRHVALKVLPPHVLPNPRQRQRFEREARAAARLHHTNIVPVFGIGEEGGLHYYVMQYIQGLGLDEVLNELRRLRQEKWSSSSGPRAGSLKESPPAASVEAVARSLLMSGDMPLSRAPDRPAAEAADVGVGPAPRREATASGSTAGLALSGSSLVLPGQSGDGRGSKAQTYWQSVARIGVQVAEALAYAHQQGVLHRDIKPANLLLDTQGNVWVTDFGLAKAGDEQDLTKTGDVLGTLRYVAPEVLAGRSDARSEVYALGLTLYELLALQPAFMESDRHRLVRRIMGEPPARLEKTNPEIPRDLVTVVHKAIDREAGCRYQTARELADDLRCFVEDQPIGARRPRPAERVLRWARRNTRLAAALLSIAALLVLGTIGSGLVAVRFRRLAAEAVAAQLEADRAAKRERWERYRSNLAAAASALQLQNTSPARRALEEAPEEYRNWEWRHLNSQLDGSRLVLSTPPSGFTTVMLVAGPVGGDVAVRLATDHRIHVWDTTTDRERAIWGEHEAPVEHLVYTRDGDRLATDSEDHTIRVWDAATGRRLAQLVGHRGPIWRLAFSPDGARIVSAGADRTYRLWDAKTGRPLAVLGSNEGEWGLTHARFSPDSRWIVTSCGREVRLWDGSTGRPLGVLGSHEHAVHHLEVSPDGRRVASQAVNEPAILLWDPLRLARVASLDLPGVPDIGVTFSPDGSRLVLAAVAFPDLAARMWESDTGRLIKLITGHKNRVTSLAYSPDNTRVVTASLDQTAFLWDGWTGEPVAALRGHSGRLTLAIFSPDGRSVVTASDDQALRIWDAKTGELISVLRGHTGEVWAAVFTGKGELISASDRALRVWDLDAAHSGTVSRHGLYVYDVAFSPDGSLVASAAWDHTVRLWDSRTARLVGRPMEHENWIVMSVAFSPDGQQLASVSRDDRIYVWGVADRKPKHILSAPTGDWSGDCRVAFHPAGTLLAGGGWDGRVRLWDVATGEPAGSLQGQQGRVHDVAFSPDGRQLASAGADASVRVWDLASRRERAHLAGHRDAVHRVAFGRMIASASRDGTVCLWDTQTYRKLAVLDHGTIVYGLAFSPDGTRLATGCKDNTIRLWDLATYQQVCELRGHTDYVHAVAFSRDGTQLVSGSGDFTVRFWDTLPVKERIQLARYPRPVGPSGGGTGRPKSSPK